MSSLRVGLVVSLSSVIFAHGVFFGASAKADDVADFYRGKKVNLLIPSAPGGGYDLYARFLSRFLSQHIPGKPQIIVKNVPGAGGILEANKLFSVEASDGLTLGEVQYTIPLNQLVRTPSLKVDVRKFPWIGSMSSSPTICAFSGKAKDLDVKDIFKSEIVIGTAGGASLMVPLLLNNLADAHFKVVPGYQSTSNVQLAMESGEVQGICGWAWDGAKVNAKDMLKRGVAKIMLDIGTQPSQELSGRGVPFLMDLLPDDERKAVLQMILSTQTYSRPFTFPPGVPTARVSALRKAFADTLKDPKFLAEARSLGLEIEYLSGEQIDAQIKTVFDAPPELQVRAATELQRAGFK